MADRHGTGKDAIGGTLEFYQLVTLNKKTFKLSSYSTSTVGIASGFESNKDSQTIQLISSLVETFGKEFSAANPNIVSSLTEERRKHPYSGEWDGEATCAYQSFPRKRPLHWSIHTWQSNGTVDVEENPHQSTQQKFDGMPDINDGKLSGPDVKAVIKLSADQNTITGTYSMHPEKCTSFTLHRTEQ